ncbi:MAG: hypothetical protein Q8L34_03065 [Candidatus Woesearchaeota archaeon]|nr:hypothetical protein [Candidatus Woesearchaeota archaeon]
MAILIIPDFKVFFAIVNKNASYDGALEAREAYELLVNLKVENKVEIILAKPIEDKIRKHISDKQAPHFYTMVEKDYSTSGVAGYDADNCIAETAKNNSFRGHVIILALDPIQKEEVIKGSRKIITVNPAKFITGHKVAMTHSQALGSKTDLGDVLKFLFFIRPEIIDQAHNSRKK